MALLRGLVRGIFAMIHSARNQPSTLDVLLAYDDPRAGISPGRIADDLRKAGFWPLTADTPCAVRADLLAWNMSFSNRDPVGFDWLISSSQAPPPKETDFSDDVIAVWKTRVEELDKHSLLRARYGDLLQAFGAQRLSKKERAEATRTAVRSVLCFLRDLPNENEAGLTVLLRRTMNLASSIRDDGLVTEVADAIISWCQLHASAEKIGTWRILQHQVLDKKRVALSASQRSSIGAIMIQMHNDAIALISSGKIHPDVLLSSATSLAKYNHKLDLQIDIEELIEKTCELAMSSIQVAGLDPSDQRLELEKVRDLARNHGCNAMAKRIHTAIDKTAREVPSLMKETTFSFEISSLEIEICVTCCIQDTLDRTLTILSHFISEIMKNSHVLPCKNKHR